MSRAPQPSLALVRAELDAIGVAATSVTRAGAGHWSTAYQFAHDGSDRIVRFGRHVSDFRKDAFAARFNDDSLPVPAVHSIGRAAYDPEIWMAVSDLVPGSPLEEVHAETWLDLIPDLVELFERLRWAPIPSGRWGGFDADGRAAEPSWHAHLLSTAVYDGRVPDWLDKLRAEPELHATHDAAVARLGLMDLSAATRSLIHGDLINRNAHVDAGRIRGVFDWGCGRFGDHLYELAWFRFWAPWHTNLDVDALEAALHRRWHDDGTVPHALSERLHASLLHIGIDHIVHAVTIDNPDGARSVIDRMDELLGRSER